MSGRSIVRSLSGKLSLTTISREHINELRTVFDTVPAVVAVSEDELSTIECRAIALLYDRGCRMFSFVGPKSEQSHDRFDETLQVNDDDVPMTTYHVDESSADTAAMLGIYVRDMSPREILLIDGSMRLSSELVTALEQVVLESYR